VLNLPPVISDACEVLRSHIGDPWDADDAMDVEYVRASPLGPLVEAIESLQEYRMAPLAWLTLYTARRALPCWELYCDSSGPLDAVRVAKQWLATGARPVDIAKLAVVTQPSYHGIPIGDCRACDTGAAAESAAQLIRFLDTRNPLNAIYCISAADSAFDQSPLVEKDHFREWLLDYAIPIAVEDREMSQQEQNALREYDAGQICQEREREAAYWNPTT